MQGTAGYPEHQGKQVSPLHALAPYVSGSGGCISSEDLELESFIDSEVDGVEKIQQQSIAY